MTPALPPGGDRSYLRTTPADDVQGAACGARRAVAGAQRVVAIHDGTTYGRGVASAFTAAASVTDSSTRAPRRGTPEAPATEGSPPDRRGRADAVFLGGGAQSNGGGCIRDLRGELGSEVLILGPDGFNFPADSSRAPVRAPRASPSACRRRRTAPCRRAGGVGSGVHERYGSRPCCYAVHAGQATELVLDAIETLRRQPRGRAQSLRRTRDRDGLLGGVPVRRFGDSTCVASRSTGSRMAGCATCAPSRSPTTAGPRMNKRVSSTVLPRRDRFGPGVDRRRRASRPSHPATSGGSTGGRDAPPTT